MQQRCLRPRNPNDKNRTPVRIQSPLEHKRASPLRNLVNPEGKKTPRTPTRFHKGLQKGTQGRGHPFNAAQLRRNQGGGEAKAGKERAVTPWPSGAEAEAEAGKAAEDGNTARTGRAERLSRWRWRWRDAPRKTHPQARPHALAAWMDDR